MQLGNDNNALMALFTLNAIFFLLLMVIKVSFYYSQLSEENFNMSVLQWFKLPASFTKFTERPWTIITYMFSDTLSGLMRLISNMLWLWSFGYLLQQMSGNEKLFPVYFYGGIGGAVLYMLAHYMLPGLHAQIDNESLIGANASVVAVATATTYLNPDYRFFSHIRRGIPIWVLFTVFILFQFAGIAGNSAALHFSTLGGALSGFLFIYFLKKGHDGSIWMHKLWFALLNLFNPDHSRVREETKKRFFYDTQHSPPFKKSPISNQQRVDEILDKINEKGFEFLTDEEKEILKKASEEE